MNYDRREFLKTLGAGFALTALNGCQLVPNIGADQPNVLFIAVDDLNDWVNVLGGRPGVQTPNIDRLARRGVVFTNAHCSAPSCNPSRASIMTGVRPSTSGIYNNRQHWRESPVLRDAKTIPEHFHSIGYQTTGGGKIFHCLSWIRTSYGSDENDYDIWDDYFPSKTRSMPESVWPEGTVRNDEGTFEWDPVARGRTDGRPSYYFDWGPLKTPDEEMADFQVVDWAISELKKEHWEKFTLWEESTRVPLMIAAPGVTTPGGRCGRPVSLLDVYPTLIELCGNRPYPSLEGQSLVPLLRDPQASREQPAVTTWGFNNHAVRTERWRYIRYNDGSEELYDHQSDPDEYTNLAGQDQFDSIKEDLVQWLPRTNALFAR